MFKLVSSLLLLFLCLTLTANAQDRRAALEFYERGRHRYTKGDLDGAVADLTQAIQLFALPHASLRRHGQGWRPTQEPGDAVSNPERISLVDPLAAAAYSDRALARHAQGDVEGALSDCEMAISINPGLAEAYNNRGTLRWANGDLDGALSDYNRVIAIDPRDGLAFNNRANILVDRGDFENALVDFSKAVDLLPRNAKSLLQPRSRLV
jgi:tetratricopeptide (TPR) repeat protein